MPVPESYEKGQEKLNGGSGGEINDTNVRVTRNFKRAFVPSLFSFYSRPAPVVSRLERRGFSVVRFGRGSCPRCAISPRLRAFSVPLIAPITVIIDLLRDFYALPIHRWYSKASFNQIHLGLIFFSLFTWLVKFFTVYQSENTLRLGLSMIFLKWKLSFYWSCTQIFEKEPIIRKPKEWEPREFDSRTELS